MSKFSTSLDVDEIHVNNNIYTILFKSINLLKEIDFSFEYNKDLNVRNFETIYINQIIIYAEYLNIMADKVWFKDENFNIIASLDICCDKLLAIRKYKSKMLSISLIGKDTYSYLIECHKDKIKNN